MKKINKKAEGTINRTLILLIVGIVVVGIVFFGLYGSGIIEKAQSIFPEFGDSTDVDGEFEEIVVTSGIALSYDGSVFWFRWDNDTGKVFARMSIFDSTTSKVIIREWNDNLTEDSFFMDTNLIASHFKTSTRSISSSESKEDMITRAAFLDEKTQYEGLKVSFFVYGRGIFEAYTVKDATSSGCNQDNPTSFGEDREARERLYASCMTGAEGWYKKDA